MGYFGVLQSAPESAVSPGPNLATPHGVGPAVVLPGIRRCHVNLWALSSLVPGRRLFYFDLGLELVAATEPVSQVEIILPFRVDEGRWPGRAKNETVAQDLYQTIATQASAELVFGGPVHAEAEEDWTKLTVGDYAEPLRLGRINVAGIKVLSTVDQRSDWSHYVVPLASPIPAGEARYVRLRFRVFGAGPLWSWKRVTGGALFDFRVYDVRESRFAESEIHLRKRMIPIDEMNVFLISPAKYQIATTSPQWKYLRLLEPGAWRSYLRGTAYLSLRSAMVVHYWRQKPDKTEESAEVVVSLDPSLPQSATGSSAGTAAVESPTSGRGAEGGQLSTNGPRIEGQEDPTPPSQSPHDSQTAPEGPTSPMAAFSGARKRPRQSINPDNPFRVFADLNPAAARVWWAEIVRVGLALVTIALIVRWTSGTYDFSQIPWKSIITILGLATVLGLVTWLERLRRFSADMFARPRGWFRSVERIILNRR